MQDTIIGYPAPQPEPVTPTSMQLLRLLDSQHVNLAVLVLRAQRAHLPIPSPKQIQVEMHRLFQAGAIQAQLIGEDWLYWRLEHPVLEALAMIRAESETKNHA